MSVEEIKSKLTALSEAERAEVSRYLRCLRMASDPEYQEQVAARLDDKDPSHWVPLEELKRRFPEDWANG